MCIGYASFPQQVYIEKRANNLGNQDPAYTVSFAGAVFILPEIMFNVAYF